MNPIRPIRVNGRVVKTPMTPTKGIRNGLQNGRKILIKYQCSAVEKRHLNMR